REGGPGIHRKRIEVAVEERALADRVERHLAHARRDRCGCDGWLGGVVWRRRAPGRIVPDRVIGRIGRPGGFVFRRARVAPWAEPAFQVVDAHGHERTISRAWFLA